MSMEVLFLLGPLGLTMVDKGAYLREYTEPEDKRFVLNSY